MKFELNIDCDNAAFEDGAQAEIARILHNLVCDIEDGRAGDCGKPGESDTEQLRDLNGNNVGSWSWDGEE